MTAEEFQAWAGEHCRVFGLSAEESGTVLSWEPYFIASGFHPHDLADTTTALVRSPSELMRLAGQARFLGKTAVHLAAIEGYIREQTACTQERESSDFEEKHGTCMVCSGTGFVVVPHLRGIKNGRWDGARIGGLAPYFYTCAVLCSCALGRWKGQRQGGTRHGGRTVPKLISLQAYEHENPAWKEQMESRAAARWEKLKISNRKIEDEIKALAERFRVRRA